MLERKAGSFLGGALLITSIFTLGVINKAEARSQVNQEVSITCWSKGHEGLEEAYIDLHVRLRNIPADISRSWLMFEDLESGERIYLVEIPSYVTGFNYTVHGGHELWGGYYLKPESDIRVWVYENHDNHPGSITETYLNTGYCPIV